MLRYALERAGFVVVTGHLGEIRTGVLDLPQFLAQHDPRVIVLDLVMPYDRNWAFMQHLRTSPGMQDRHFVLSAPNVAAVHRVVGTGEPVFEVVGDDDLDAIVLAVREAAKACATR